MSTTLWIDGEGVVPKRLKPKLEDKSFATKAGQKKGIGQLIIVMRRQGTGGMVLRRQGPEQLRADKGVMRVSFRATVSMVMLMFALGTASAGNPGGLQKPEAVSHFTKGNALYKAGDFEEAIKEYKAGMLVEPSAVFNFNLGQSYRQLGDYKQAKWQYQRYLASDLASEDEREAIKKLIASMDAEAQQKARTDPPTEPATLNATPITPNDKPLGRQEQSRWYHDGVGWSISGTGVVAGVVSGVLFLQAADYSDDASAAATAEEARALNDKSDTRRMVGIVTGVVATSLVAAGIIKLAIHKSSSGESVALGVSSNGFVVTGRF